MEQPEYPLEPLEDKKVETDEEIVDMDELTEKEDISEGSD